MRSRLPAPGWRLDADADGLLLRAPGGALRVDGPVAEVWERGETRHGGRLFSAVTREVLAQLGALDADAVGEPPRPAAPTGGPLVSVIVPTHDGAALLADCLRSLAGQSYERIEVVVVDGASTDGTAAMLRRDHPAATLVELGDNPGFSAANNAGVRAATGELLLLLNNDTVLEPDAVAQLVRVARQRPLRLAAVCAMTRRADLPQVVESLGNVAGMAGYGAGRYAGFVDFGQFAEEGELFSAAFTAVLLARDAWNAVGPLDERYGYYYEDVDWSLRARMGGLKIWPAPHALVYHRGSASVDRRPDVYKLRLVTRNRLLWAGKVLRMRNAAGFARRYVREDLHNVRGAVRDGRHAEALAILRAWAAASAQLPALWQARQRLARWHIVPDEVLFRAAAAAAPLMDRSYPRLEAPTVRGHYLHLPELQARARPTRAASARAG